MSALHSYLYRLVTGKERGLVAALARGVLAGCALIYGAVVWCIRLYRRNSATRFGCKVVSIGNITVGGTGKTPLVALVAGVLRSHGHKVAVVSRGYGAPTPEAADEPMMLRMQLGDIPVVVSADRKKAIRQAIADYAVDAVVLDDGLQQWGIKKDCEIVTIDASCPFGNRRMLPAGLLREPLSALRRADIIVLTKTEAVSVDSRSQLKAFLGRLNPDALIAEAVYVPVGLIALGAPQELLPLALLKGNKLAAFCGIADPDSFKRTLGELGAQVDVFMAFADHHCYTQQEWDAVCAQVRGVGLDTIVTTEKDLVKLAALPDAESLLKVHALRITVVMPHEKNRFTDRLLGMAAA